MACLACDRSPDTTPKQIELVRQSEKSPYPPDATVPDARRFGWESSGLAPGEAGSGSPMPTPSETAPNPATGAETAPPQYTWTTPNGWTESPSTEFRNPNFVFGTDNAGECYVTTLPGDGGGLAQNINRWRKQMGLAEMAAIEMADLPTLPVLGEQAVYLQLEGTFTGMGSQAARENFGMLGALLIKEGHGVFIKLTTPAAEAAAQRENFESFCRSLKQTEHANPPVDHAVSSPTPAPSPGAELPAPPSAEGRLSFTLPQGWREAQGDPMRAATFHIGDETKQGGLAEVSIFLLPGAAGGEAANFNRWRRQMGLGELSPAELDALPSIEVAGQPAKLLEVTGDYTGMTGPKQPDYGMLGIASSRENETLFIKLTAPKAVALAEKERFVEFCRQLRLK